MKKLFLVTAVSAALFTATGAYGQTLCKLDPTTIRLDLSENYYTLSVRRDGCEQGFYVDVEFRRGITILDHVNVYMSHYGLSGTWSRHSVIEPNNIYYLITEDRFDSDSKTWEGTIPINASDIYSGGSTITYNSENNYYVVKFGGFSFAINPETRHVVLK